MDIHRQPFRDFDPRPDTDFLYREMVQRNNQDREKISRIMRKKLDRQKYEDGIRARWDLLSVAEQQARIDQLREICNELTQSHPNFIRFKTAEVTVKDGMCTIHWNGTNPDKVTGFAMADRVFPAGDTDIVTKRYRDRLYQKNKEEDDL